MESLSHFDESGATRMVDVGGKEPSHRVAVATGIVRMLPATLELIRNKALAKGDVFEVARLAGIMAAKKTSELIPLCHPLALNGIAVHFEVLATAEIRIRATVRIFGRTGVEMEALTAVSVAGLTIYDMCKAVDRGMSLESIRIEEKSGGFQGDYTRPPD